MRVLLEVQSGKQTGRKISLQSGQDSTIGRGLDAEVAFPEDSFMSSLHCILQCGVKICTITDRNSSNGVLVNGSKIKSVALKTGDEIVVGQTQFSVQLFEDSEGRPFDDAALTGRDLVSVLRDEFQPLYVLLDAALNRDVPALLAKSGAEHQSLYEGKKGEDLAAVAPYLVRVLADSPLLKTMESEGYRKNWGVFLTCRLPLKELRKHLRHFLTVKLPDDDKVFFRFYDPRVLRVFLPTCDEKQSAEFFGPAKTFLVEDEQPSQFLRFWSDKKGVEQAKLTLTSRMQERR